MNRITRFFKIWWVRIIRCFNLSYIATECGHKTKMHGVLGRGDESTKFHLGYDITTGRPEYCLACIDAMEIACAWCGKPIQIGDPITVYERFIGPIQKRARLHGDTAVVGCLRRNCADGAHDRAGFWVEPGQVHRILSPMEMIMQNLAAGGGARAVIVSDISDPNDHGRLI